MMDILLLPFKCTLGMRIYLAVIPHMAITIVDSIMNQLIMATSPGVKINANPGEKIMATLPDMKIMATHPDVKIITFAIHAATPVTPGNQRLSIINRLVESHSTAVARAPSTIPQEKLGHPV